MITHAGLKTLVLQDGLFAEILRLPQLYDGLEFAVTLFGHIRGDRFAVSRLAPPGRKAKQAYGRCTGDDEFESDFFNELRKTEPGIQWLGDLHAHPPSHPQLSGTDRATIHSILFGG